MSPLHIWFMAARPRTLPAAVAPVLVGTALAATDGMAGVQQLAGDATLLFYMNEEAQEGRNAYVEKRKPDFKKFTRVP